MAKVKINDTELEVPNGINMIEAAKLAGVEIPHYCYHPDLSVAGNCRMCLVESVTPRGPVLEIACNMQARDGLAIRTDSAQVLHMRKSVMEFLLVNHPLDCPICDQSGECRLQDYYMEHAGHDSRGLDPKVGKNKRQDIGEHIVLDAERCVQCSRCERFSDEVTGTGELRLMNRGDHTEIGIFPGERLSHNYQGNLADICPVGALTGKDFRFQRRVWYLKETDSVCTKCATGCNTRVCHQEGEVFRYLPRRNDQVNKSWMCDTGRFSYAEVSGLSRILKASVDGTSVDVDVATAELGKRIRAAGSRVAFVLGTRATNEANWALLQSVRLNVPNAKVFVVEGNDGGEVAEGDALLLSADRNPNTNGARLLARHDGKIEGAEELGASIADIDLLVVLEDDVVGRLGGERPKAIAYFGCSKNATSVAASIVIPTAHAVEMDGSYVNRADRVQRVRRATNPMGDAAPAYVAVDKLGARLGKAPGTQMVTVAFNAMAKAVARLNGIDFKSLGTGGAVLAPDPSSAPVGVEAAT
jgi:NADH-quinone oxidoreductase subunit G